MVLAIIVSAPADPWMGYPPWLVAAGLTVVVACAIWLLAKILKWALWLLLIAVLVGGFGLTLWMLLQ